MNRGVTTTVPSEQESDESRHEIDTDGLLSNLSEYAPYHHTEPEIVHGSPQIKQTHDRVEHLRRVLEESEEFYRQQWGDDE